MATDTTFRMDAIGSALRDIAPRLGVFLSSRNDVVYRHALTDAVEFEISLPRVRGRVAIDGFELLRMAPATLFDLLTDRVVRERDAMRGQSLVDICNDEFSLPGQPTEEQVHAMERAALRLMSSVDRARKAGLL